MLHYFTKDEFENHGGQVLTVIAAPDKAGVALGQCCVDAGEPADFDFHAVEAYQLPDGSYDAPDMVPSPSMILQRLLELGDWVPLASAV